MENIEDYSGTQIFFCVSNERFEARSANVNSHEVSRAACPEIRPAAVRAAS